MANTFTDITSLIHELAQELPIGGMVQHPEFSLHRSMSAIELMDPKMDTGMNVTNLPTMSERIKDGTLPIQMDLSQATRVIDVLLCQETAHRTGCSMPTSIVTCMYTHDDVLVALKEASGSYLSGAEATNTTTQLPECTDQAVITASVYAYSLAMLKCTRIFYNVVKIGDIYEDEDFCDYERYPSPKQEGGRLRLVLGDHVDDAEMQRALDVTIAECERRATTTTSTTTNTKGWEDLATRLRMRQSWWNLMTAIRPLTEKLLLNEQELATITVSERIAKIRTLVSTQLHSVERECANTLRYASDVKTTMERVWSNRNPKEAAIKLEEQRIQELTSRTKEEADGNVNEIEYARLNEGTYDERDAIGVEGGIKYGVDHRVSKEFVPAGPPRKKTEIHVPTVTLQHFERHVSHLIAVVKCQEYVVSVETFEKSQRKEKSVGTKEATASTTETTATAAAAKPRGTTTLQSMRDYMSDMVQRCADVFSRSVLNLLILGPLTRSVISEDGKSTIRPAMLLGRGKYSSDAGAM